MTPLTPAPEDLGAIRDAARLAGMLPVLRQHVEKAVREVENRVFSAIHDRKLTPEEAYNAWMEVHSHRKLLKSLEVQVRIGQSLGEKNASGLQQPVPLPI